MNDNDQRYICEFSKKHYPYHNLMHCHIMELLNCLNFEVKQADNSWNIET